MAESKKRRRSSHDRCHRTTTARGLAREGEVMRMIRYHLTVKRLEATPPVVAEVESWLAKLERRARHFSPDLLHADVELERRARREEYVARIRLAIVNTVLVTRKKGATLQEALKEAGEDMERRLERYKARLRRDYAHERKRASLSAEEIASLERELLEDKELLDRSLAGDREAFEELTERELPQLTRYLRRRLRQAGVADDRIEALLPEVLADTLQAAFERLAQKPPRMSMQAWLALQARELLRRRPPETLSEPVAS